MRQLIIRGAPAGAQKPRRRAILYGIDIRLKMLNPEADGKGFSFHGDFPFLQPCKCITRAVSDCQNNAISFQLAAPLRTAKQCAADAAAAFAFPIGNPIQPRSETDLRA